jgi:hypothetical protein
MKIPITMVRILGGLYINLVENKKSLQADDEPGTHALLHEPTS